MKDHFLYRFYYQPDVYVSCKPIQEIVFPQLQRILFFKDSLYVFVGEKCSYYGSFRTPLPEEFRDLPSRGWEIDMERKLYYAILNIDIVKGIASLYPTVDHPFDPL